MQFWRQVRIKERSKIVDRNCVQQRLVGSGVSGGHSPVASKQDGPPQTGAIVLHDSGVFSLNIG